MTERTEESSPGEAEQQGWNEAMAELDRILSELEADDVDIDTLTDRVERAGELIELCRDRISGARARVDELVAELVPDGTADG